MVEKLEIIEIIGVISAALLIEENDTGIHHRYITVQYRPITLESYSLKA